MTMLDLYALGFGAAMTRRRAARVPRRRSRSLDPMVGRARRARPAGARCSCSSTRRGGAGRRRCSRAGSSGCSCPASAFAFDERGQGRGRRMEHVRRIVGVSTYGSPWTYIKLITDGGRRMITRALRMSCGGARRPTWLGLYSDRHRRRRRAAGVPRPGRAHAWASCASGVDA